jgi:hypothetical protein
MTAGPDESPTRFDIETNRALLIQLLTAFPEKPPALTSLEKGFLGYDAYYRHSLSKSNKTKQRKTWAAVDSVNVRRMLSYVFMMVRTQKGNVNARYPALGELKALVRSPSVMRRSTDLATDCAHSEVKAYSNLKTDRQSNIVNKHVLCFV